MLVATGSLFVCFVCMFFCLSMCVCLPVLSPTPTLSTQTNYCYHHDRRIVEELLRLLDEATGAADIDVVDLVRGALASHRVELRRLKDVFEYYDRKGTGKVTHQYTLSTPFINTPSQHPSSIHPIILPINTPYNTPHQYFL